MWTHLGALLLDVGGLLTCGISSLLLWIPPLVILNGPSGTDPFVRRHARQSLNFAFTELITAAVLVMVVYTTGGLGALLAIPLALVIWIAAIVFRILATTTATRGTPYDYPVSIPFLR
ncbi:DUF4870 domain-containing protein [Nonomuraea terrae]|uniref:DUF4870 domain-containing protein n=1 Tax=Nonomuraea terrae TaxID=2530383 RepID=A0A4R4YLE6_9ACTN|nr:DUF4870 domain-containing protein [Nonomuraea terrae]TDD45811.1 DUF4870 domain-containing protein [Nonomuraea terrae]